MVIELDSDKFLLDNGSAFLINDAQKRTVAPDGFYNLTNGTIVGVKNNSVTPHSFLRNYGPNNFFFFQWAFQLWAFSQISPDNNEKFAPAADDLQPAKLNVRYTFNRIVLKG